MCESVPEASGIWATHDLLNVRIMHSPCSSPMAGFPGPFPSTRGRARTRSRRGSETRCFVSPSSSRRGSQPVSCCRCGSSRWPSPAGWRGSCPASVWSTSGSRTSAPTKSRPELRGSRVPLQARVALEMLIPLPPIQRLMTLLVSTRLRRELHPHDKRNSRRMQSV